MSKFVPKNIYNANYKQYTFTVSGSDVIILTHIAAYPPKTRNFNKNHP
jgi:hypothetical protein